MQRLITLLAGLIDAVRHPDTRDALIEIVHMMREELENQEKNESDSKQQLYEDAMRTIREQGKQIFTLTQDLTNTQSELSDALREIQIQRLQSAQQEPAVPNPEKLYSMDANGLVMYYQGRKGILTGFYKNDTQNKRIYQIVLSAETLWVEGDELWSKPTSDYRSRRLPSSKREKK